MAGILGRNIYIAIVAILFFGFASPVYAQKSSLKLSEQTKHYSIKGKTAPQFAASMSRRGPYSRQHGRRAWATATRDMTYQLFHRKSKGTCRVKAVRVKLKTTYVLPKLASKRGVSNQQLKKWNRMYGLLKKHERTHGEFYKQFGRKVYTSLRKMKPARTCRQLDRNAAAIVARLGAEDKRRNVKFDRRDRRNYRSMERLYSGA
ncbi:MAG: DUF922 domain-containing protein [Rhizobiaceae bacterium]